MEIAIESERLYLRKWRNEDRPIFARMNADPSCMEYFPKILNEEESYSLVDKIQKHLIDRNYGLWAVEEKESNCFIGFIGFSYTEMETYFSPCIEIGWRLIKSAWGKGYATEGAKSCLNYAYHQLGLDEILSFTSRLNTRSENIMKKIGMKKIGKFNHPKIVKDNRLCEHVLYKISRDEYFLTNGYGA